MESLTTGLRCSLDCFVAFVFRFSLNSLDTSQRSQINCWTQTSHFCFNFQLPYNSPPASSKKAAFFKTAFSLCSFTRLRAPRSCGPLVPGASSKKAEVRVSGAKVPKALGGLTKGPRTPPSGAAAARGCPRTSPCGRCPGRHFRRREFSRGGHSRTK